MVSSAWNACDLAVPTTPFFRMSFEHQFEVETKIADAIRLVNLDVHDEIRDLITVHTSFLQEAMVVLELAVWKGKFCEAFLKFHRKDGHYKIRSETRTKSGAVCAVMIPLVLPFLCGST